MQCSLITRLNDCLVLEVYKLLYFLYLSRSIDVVKFTKC